LAVLQIFSPEITLIRDQVLINVGANDPKHVYEQIQIIVYAAFTHAGSTTRYPGTEQKLV